MSPSMRTRPVASVNGSRCSPAHMKIGINMNTGIDKQARFLGLQQAPAPMPTLELWNLLGDFPGHCKGSTVTRSTLDRLGIQPDQEEAARATQAWHDWNNSGVNDDHTLPL